MINTPPRSRFGRGGFGLVNEMAYKDKEKEKERNRAYHEANSKKIRERKRAYYEANLEKEKERKRAYREANPEKIKETQRAYYIKNKLVLAEKRIVYYEKYKPRANELFRKRRETDVLFAMRCRIRCLIQGACKKKNYTKTSRTHEILGCDYETFAAHLESQFVDGMNWDNRNEWHIDHIIPIASAQTEEDVLRLNHYTNLRPLWAEENMAKSARMPPVHIQQRVNAFYAKSKGVRIPLKQQPMFDYENVTL